MGTNENSKNIYISHGITPKERKLERMLKKRENEWRKNKREWISPLTRKPKRVNKMEKLVKKFEWTNQWQELYHVM